MDNKTVFLDDVGKLTVGKSDRSIFYISAYQPGVEQYIDLTNLSMSALFDSSSESGNQRSLDSCSAVKMFFASVPAEFILTGYYDSDVLAFNHFLWPSETVFIVQEDGDYYILDTVNERKFFPPINFYLKQF